MGIDEKETPLRHTDVHAALQYDVHSEVQLFSTVYACARRGDMFSVEYTRVIGACDADDGRDEH